MDKRLIAGIASIIIVVILWALIHSVGTVNDKAKTPTIKEKDPTIHLRQQIADMKTEAIRRGHATLSADNKLQWR